MRTLRGAQHQTTTVNPARYEPAVRAPLCWHPHGAGAALPLFARRLRRVPSLRHDHGSPGWFRNMPTSRSGVQMRVSSLLLNVSA